MSQLMKLKLKKKRKKIKTKKIVKLIVQKTNLKYH